jgi:2-polyprenyl-6-hydroxyphenyl methylase/3-demethylubiquinone-9 3-methyltransferase
MPGENYYSKKLSALKLKRCYDIASPRVKEYLDEEIKYVARHLNPKDTILELGCGYGRVMAKLANLVEAVYGIDVSAENIEFAHKFLKGHTNIELFHMNANTTTFPKETFEAVIAIQNAVSAFKIPPKTLILESLRITKPKGKVILSSYSDKFWTDRFEWFKAQANEGLLGEIDFEQTKNGVIVCQNGFIASTFSRYDFEKLVEDLELEAIITEVNNSSIFCVIKKHARCFPI